MPSSKAAPPGGAKAKCPAPALERGLLMLDFLRRRPRGARVAEIVQALEIPPASAYRLLTTLEARRFVVRDANDERFRLGSEILLLAGSVLSGMDLRRLAHPLMEDLFQRATETVELAILEARQLIVIDKVEGEESVHVHNVGGHRSPFLDSAGLVLLAHLNPERLDAMYHEAVGGSRKMIFNRRRLLEVLESARQQGYLIDDGPDFDQPWRRSRRIAAPIRDHVGRASAVLSIAVAYSRWKPETLPKMIRRVRGASGRISELMGFQEQLDSRQAGKK